jgi:peptidoglycan-associated lipoprotein
MSIVLLTLIIGAAGCKKNTRTIVAGSPSDTVSVPSEPSPKDVSPMVDPSVAELDELTRKFLPVFFDFNRFEIRDDQVSALQNNAGVLKQNPHVNVILEGHCDERGTQEYNLALGESRARVVRDYLVHLGIDANRIETISYGEDKPFSIGSTEESWAQNRRAQSVVLKQQ